MRFRCNADRLTIDGFPGYVGVRVRTQAEADERVPKLLTMPAAVGVLLIEPRERIDWWRSVVYQKDYYCAICEKWFDHSAEKVSCRDCGEETVWAGDSCPECDSIAEPDMICPECGTDGSRGGLDHAEVCQQQIVVQHGHKIGWVIVQGGNDPIHPEWVRSIRDQCQAAGVPFFFKQWGAWCPISEGGGEWYESLYRSNKAAREGESQAALDDCYGRTCTVEQLCLRADGDHVSITDAKAWQQGTGSIQAFRVGKKVAGRMLDGRTWDEMPTTAGKAGG